MLSFITNLEKAPHEILPGNSSPITAGPLNRVIASYLLLVIVIIIIIIIITN